MKITQKLLEVMKALSTCQDLGKLNNILIEQKLITTTEYALIDKEERITPQGVVWRFITVSCKLTILDTESSESIVNVAFDSVMDKTDKAISIAQARAKRNAWMATLNDIVAEIVPRDEVVSEPEIIVETAESKLITQIRALWKWDASMFPEYIAKRFTGRFIEDLNITELTVIADELRNYRG